LHCFDFLCMVFTCLHCAMIAASTSCLNFWHHSTNMSTSTIIPSLPPIKANLQNSGNQCTINIIYCSMNMRYIHVVLDNDYFHSHIPIASVINNNETNANMAKESRGHTSLTSCKQQTVMLDYFNKLHQHHP
jgi:hypothetical protein